MYCTCCGEVIDPEEVVGEEICNSCNNMINSNENISDEDEDLVE